MANLTLTIDDEVLRKARIRAAEEGTSVNAIVREQLEIYSGARDQQRQAVKSILDMAASTTAGSGGRTWSREQIYEERLERWGRGTPE